MLDGNDSAWLWRGDVLRCDCRLRLRILWSSLGHATSREVRRGYEAQGYERKSGQVIDETTPITENRVYTAQVVTIRTDADADLAIMSQAAEIDGTVRGDIDFYGQVLTIKPGGVVEGDIRVQGAQVISVKGTVEGEISGSYQVLDWPDRNRSIDGHSSTTVDVEVTPEPEASLPE